MPKASPIQNAFNAGEFSPLLRGRQDIDKYAKAVDVCLNYIPTVQGPLQERNGTRFVQETKDSSKKSRIVEFEFSTEQAYAIEFGDLYLRFYRNKAPITNLNATVTGATQANPVVISAVNTFANGDPILLTDILGTVELNNREFEVANVTGTTFELLGIDGTTFTAYISGGNADRILEVTSPFTEAQLFKLKFTQSADVLYIAHPDVITKKLSRTSNILWTVTDVDFANSDGPYLQINNTTTTLTPSAVTGTITITASSVVGINSGQGFLSTDVGRLVRILHGSTWGYAEITVFTSSTLVTALVKRDFGATTASGTWRLGVYSTTTGFPAALTFFENRLFFGGPTAFPQRVDGSKTADFENFQPTDGSGVVADDNAVAFDLNANQVNAIRWMTDDEKALIIGTTGGEWPIRPSLRSEALTPTNITGKRSLSYGSENVAPVRADRATIYTQRFGRKVRELSYIFDVDGFKAPDLAVLAEHITRGKVLEMAYTRQPQSIVWMVRGDGTLLGMTYERDQDVIGWHRHELGGSFSGQTGSARGEVESVASIPANDGSQDELWLIVKRTIDGGIRRYVEFIENQFEDEDDIADAFFVDSGLTFDGAPASIISGAFHLRGETIDILTDGGVHPSKVVSANGIITLDFTASKAHAGFGYNADGSLLPLEAGAADGSAQGKTKRIDRVVFRLHNSVGLSVGPDFDNLDPLIFRTAAQATATAVPPFTGDIETDGWDGDYDTFAPVVWRQPQPLPSTIVAVMPQLTTQDES